MADSLRRSVQKRKKKGATREMCCHESQAKSVPKWKERPRVVMLPESPGRYELKRCTQLKAKGRDGEFGDLRGAVSRT